MFQKCPTCDGIGEMFPTPGMISCPTCNGERIIHAELGCPPSAMAKKRDDVCEMTVEKTSGESPGQASQCFAADSESKTVGAFIDDAGAAHELSYCYCKSERHPWLLTGLLSRYSGLVELAEASGLSIDAVIFCADCGRAVVAQNMPRAVTRWNAYVRE